MFACAVLEKPFFRAIVRCTGQTRKPYEQRNLLFSVARGLRGKVEVEGHFAPRAFGTVTELYELAAEAGNSCLRLNRRHFWSVGKDNGASSKGWHSSTGARPS